MIKWRVTATKTLRNKQLDAIVRAADLGIDNIFVKCGRWQLMTFSSKRMLSKTKIRKIIDIVKQADEQGIYSDIKVEMM